MRAAIDLRKLIEDFGSEAKCRAHLEALRWQDGFVRPRCKGRAISKTRARNQYDCDACRCQFSATVGTIFHDSHLPLWKWFLAM